MSLVFELCLEDLLGCILHFVCFVVVLRNVLSVVIVVVCSVLHMYLVFFIFVFVFLVCR